MAAIVAFDIQSISGRHTSLLESVDAFGEKSDWEWT
jgi:hypothetical protein